MRLKTKVERLLRSLARPPAARAASPVPSGMTTGKGGAYVTRYADDDVVRGAGRDGGASVHVESLWGENSRHAYFIEILNAAQAGNVRLVAHHLRGALYGLHERVEQTLVMAQESLQLALGAVEDHGVYAHEKENVRERSGQEGAGPLPSGRVDRKYAGALLLLMFGDLLFISVAFQLFGLSDETLLGIPFLDELHIAATASVAALLFLAHLAGPCFKVVWHQIERHRRAVDEKAREALPKPDRISLCVGVLYVVLGVLLLTGIALVRVSYLEQSGIDAQALAFALVQLGIFGAALGLSFAHAHPFGSDWKDASHAEREAAETMESACETHAARVATHNALLDEVDAVLAQAGHHVRVSGHDTIRQAYLYVREVQLTQPEPTSERLFDDKLPAPETFSDEQLRAVLLGITGLPKFERLSTAAVTTRRSELRAQVVGRREAGRTPAAPATPAAFTLPVITVTPPPAEAAATNGGGH